MNLFFDLDGTLTDPLPGIARSIQHALVALGTSEPALSDLRRFVGPPLRRSLAELLGTSDAATVARAIEVYRERFARIGMFENAVYPGVVEELERLVTDGHLLWVVTSKPDVYARQIIDHFELRRFFQAVYGSGLDGRLGDKSELIRTVLERESLNPVDTWMIGDHGDDIRGGRANGVRTAAVLWGYGTEEELVAARPDALVHAIWEVGPVIDGRLKP